MKHFLEVTILQLPTSDCSYEQATDRDSSGSYSKLYNMNMYLSNYLLLCLHDQLCFHKAYHPANGTNLFTHECFVAISETCIGLVDLTQDLLQDLKLSGEEASYPTISET